GGADIAATPDQAPTTPARRPTESHPAPPDQSAPTARVPFPPPGYTPPARSAGNDTQSRPRPLAGDNAPAEPLFPGPRQTSTRSRMVGRWIGPWWVLDELGRGGMGVVYKARDAEGSRVVALKVLHEREAASPQVAQRFRTEAEVMAQLRHPGIVAVFDIGQTATYTWIAMEFVAGVTLDRLLHAPAQDHLSLEEGARETIRPLPAPEAVDLIRQVAEAVQAAHDAGVVHRDLKLANVLREPSGRVKVMDFGLAKVLDTRAGNLTRSGVLMGTPGYMSPEMAEGKSAQVDGRSDIYQMGAMLYELTTAHPPYEGSAALETVMRIAGGEAPTPPTRWTPGLDSGVQQIIATAMARNPDRRFATARALADACARWLALGRGR
ncbi:MAG: serine/threonine protein kinase, partial [Burkholderiales bacterium]|nr:serine/threonine protein kinase [Burkholderiales bacterium]